MAYGLMLCDEPPRMFAKSAGGSSDGGDPGGARQNLPNESNPIRRPSRPDRALCIVAHTPQCLACKDCNDATTSHNSFGALH
jgi:hypothetical protein